MLMWYSGNPKDDEPLGTKYFVVHFKRYSSGDPNVGYKMGSEIGVDNAIYDDARIKMDSDDELDDYYIFSNENFFVCFCNEIKDEWINSLQVDFSTS
ncbi:hypothetical protein POTOM_005763 [Populus tomentosa]|uniref:Uncharacterized protein n=1 Tax=Populus tomentosa TaxID=118781 RepID=A0A8X8AM21_POPTO|nr:hypothetical protein POTOM_005763 [Populus tomentosa]